MTTSLKKSVIPEKLALLTIPLIMQTSLGSNMSFVIVEDEFDREVYYKFFDFRLVQIYTSSLSEENTSGGNKNVIRIVTELCSRIKNIPVLGIIDADYTRFNPAFSISGNIFRTDSRDIEMMMFQCPQVHYFLNIEFGNFHDYYLRSIVTAKQLGYIRLANDVHKLRFNFKRYLKFNRILNSQTGDLDIQSFEEFTNLFFANISNYSQTDFDQLLSQYTDIPDDQLCRGHDVLTLLANYLKNRTRKQEIHLYLAFYYSRNTFSQTRLFSNLRIWSQSNNRQLFINQAYL